ATDPGVRHRNETVANVPHSPTAQRIRRGGNVSDTVTDLAPSADPVAQDADALDLQLDLVAGLEPALVAVLEDAAGADRARADHVARPQRGVAPRVLDDRLPRVVHVTEVPPRALLAVNSRDHLQAQVAERVGRDDDRPERRREILPLRRPEADPH